MPIAPGFALFLLLWLFVSCGREEKYVDATVGEVVAGVVISETQTYRLTRPEIVAIEKDFALLKDGNHLQILSADGIEDSLAALEGKDYSLLVKNWANPYPHFRLRGFEVDGVRQDVSFVLAESELPLLMDRAFYDTSFFEKVDLSEWSEGGPPADIIEKQIWVTGCVERQVEVMEVQEEGEEDQERAVEIVHYFLASDDARLELLPIEENGVNLLLEGLARQDGEAQFGGSMTGLTPPGARDHPGLLGTFRVAVFDYGGKICLLR